MNDTPRPRGRPTLAPEDRKQQISLRVAPDVAQAMRDNGAAWIEAVVRKAMAA